MSDNINKIIDKLGGYDKLNSAEQATIDSYKKLLNRTLTIKDIENFFLTEVERATAKMSEIETVGEELIFYKAMYRLSKNLYDAISYNEKNKEAVNKNLNNIKL